MSDDEKRAWYQRVLGKKKRPDPKTVDTQSLVIGGTAVALYRRALGWGVTLNGALSERKDAIDDALLAQRYDDAQELLDAYRDDIETSKGLMDDVKLFVDPPNLTQEEQGHAALLRRSIAEDIDAMKLDEAADEIHQLSIVLAGAEMRVDLGLPRAVEWARRDIEGLAAPDDATAAEQKDIDALRAAALKCLDGDPSDKKVTAARAATVPLRKAVDAVNRRLAQTMDDPAQAYVRLRMRADDVLNYPVELRSSAITTLRKAIDTADRRAKAKVAAIPDGGPEAVRTAALHSAAAAVNELRMKIDAARHPLKQHDAEARRFYATLKRLRSRIDMADGVPAKDGARNLPWKAEREAYDLLRAKVINAQDKKDFKDANVQLALCDSAIESLLSKRRVKIDADIQGVADDEDARDLVDQLEADGLLKALTPDQQLALLRALPTDDDNDPARIKLFANSTMDPKFVEEEAKVLRDVVKMLRGDDGPKATAETREAKRKWQEAEAQWQALTGRSKSQLDAVANAKDKGKGKGKAPPGQDLARVQAIFQDIAERQFKQLCKLAGFQAPGDYPPGFPDPPVTVELVALKPSLFGETTPQFPAKITINSNHRMFGDFKEMMDTILHENAHAWQNMIVAQFKGRGCFRPVDQAKLTGSDVMKKQAELFAQNDSSYFNDDASREAYRHEPLEEQAWTFGGKSATALLVPPVARSFDSGKGLKNKLWAVASLSRSPNALVRLTNRHGIYTDEWEGEEAGDKKLTLEGVPGLSSGTALRIQTVVDEYTLMLDLDASALRGRMVPQTEVDDALQALLRKRHKRKSLSDLKDKQRQALFDEMLDKNGWVAEGSETDQTRVVRATDEVDAEHARLVLDETVAKLA